MERLCEQCKWQCEHLGYDQGWFYKWFNPLWINLLEAIKIMFWDIRSKMLILPIKWTCSKNKIKTYAKASHVVPSKTFISFLMWNMIINICLLFYKKKINSSACDFFMSGAAYETLQKKKTSPKIDHTSYYCYAMEKVVPLVN